MIRCDEIGRFDSLVVDPLVFLKKIPLAMSDERVINHKHPSGSRADVHLYGATVTSFFTATVVRITSR